MVNNLNKEGRKAIKEAQRAFFRAQANVDKNQNEFFSRHDIRLAVQAARSARFEFGEGEPNL